MSISSIESVLQQMRALAPSMGSAPASGGEAVAAGGFAGELQKSLARISSAQQSASSQAEAFEMGKPGVSLNDVMVDSAKAGIGFQTGIQLDALMQASRNISEVLQRNNPSNYANAYWQKACA